MLISIEADNLTQPRPIWGAAFCRTERGRMKPLAVKAHGIWQL